MALSDEERIALGEVDPTSFISEPEEPDLGAIERATHSNPDQVAKNLKLSEDVGLPYQMVETNTTEAKRLDRLRIIEAWNLPNRSPRTARWLSEDRNASVAIDDVELLESIEKLRNYRPWYDISVSDFEGLGDSMMIGLGKVYDQSMIGFLSGVDQTNIPEDVRQKMGLTPEKLEQNKIEREEQIKKHIQNLGFAEEYITSLTPEDLTVMGQGVRGGFQMMADMAPGLAITAATRGAINPVLYMLTAKAGLESYGSARVEGKGHGQALLYGGTDAVLELITEKFPTKMAEKMFKDIGTGNIKEAMGKFIVGDMVGEQIATFTQTINAVAHDLDKELANATTWSEKADIQIERQVVTAIATMVGSGGISGAAWSADRALNRKKRENKKLNEHIQKRMQSASSQEWLDKQIFLSQNSKLNERSSEAFADYLEKLDDQKAHVFLTAKIAAEIENAPEYITKQLDGTGADVSIPLSKFLTDFVKNEELMTQVRSHIRVQEDLYTIQEVEDNSDTEQINNMISKSRKMQEAKTEADMIYEQVVDQLRATGRLGEHTSRLSAELIPAYIVTQQAKLKARGIERTVKQLYEDMELTIGGPKAEPTKKQDTEVIFNQAANSMGLVVGGKTVGGVVFQGETGQIHAQLQEKYPQHWAQDAGSGETASPEMGFVDGDGKFYTRKEALELVRKEIPDMPGFAEGTGVEDQLESVTYRYKVKKHLSQAEQTEYDAAVAKGLDMSEGARKFRAKKMGYDVGTVWYHGTNRAFGEFKKDPEGRGRPFTFVTRSAEEASMFAEGSADDFDTTTQIVMPLYVKIGKVFDYESKTVDEMRSLERYLLKRTGNNVVYSQVVKGEWFAIEGKMVQQWLRDNNYDSFYVNEIGEKNLAVFEPSQIRSVNAAFDPDSAASPKILSQQKFGDLKLTRTGVDSGGNKVTITESAQSLWNTQQKRVKMVEKLRACVNG